MHVEFEIRGHFHVPDGTRLLAGASNLFQLPSGKVVSVHPVIEMASDPEIDDHRDLTTAEGAVLGGHLDLYDRQATLHDNE